MAKSRFDNLAEEKRETLLREAGREFAEAGYEHASLNDIIDRADFSKGSLYYYFEDKKDVYETVITRAAEQITEEFGFSEESLTAETFWEELEGLMYQSLEVLQYHDWYIDLLRSVYRMRDRHPEEGPAADLFDAGRGWIRRVLEQGRRLGAIRDDVPLDFMVEVSMGVTDACDQWMLSNFEELNDGEWTDLSARQFEMIRRMLEPPESG